MDSDNKLGEWASRLSRMTIRVPMFYHQWGDLQSWGSKIDWLKSVFAQVTEDQFSSLTGIIIQGVFHDMDLHFESIAAVKTGICSIITADEITSDLESLKFKLGQVCVLVPRIYNNYEERHHFFEKLSQIFGNSLREHQSSIGGVGDDENLMKKHSCK